jgi:PAS domain S-box-containing protein
MERVARVLVVGGGDAARAARDLLAADERFAPASARAEEVGAGLADERVDCLVAAHGDDADAPAVLERARSHAPDLPAVVYTAAGSESLASRVVDAGVDGYLRHDADAEDLPATVAAAVEDHRSGRALRRTEARYRSLVEQNLVGIYVIHGRTFEYVNPRFAELFGYERAELEGTQVADLVAPADRERVLGNLDRRMRGEMDSVQYTFTAQRKSGEHLDVEVHGSRIERPDGGVAVMGTLIDRTDERRRSRTLGALYEATEELARAESTREVCATAVESAREVLGLDVSVINLVNDDGHLAPASATEAAEAVFGDVPTFTEADGAVWRAYAGGEFVVERGDVAFAPGAERAVVAPLGDHGVFVAVADGSNSLDGDSVELLRLLSANVAAALDRAERESRVNRLHRATRQLMSAPDEEAVATVSTETAREVLGFAVCAIYVPADGGDELRPAAWTDAAERLFDEIPTFRPGESLAWRVFETGEPIVAGDVRTLEGLYDPDTAVRSEMILPLGDRGVFLAGSERSDAFDDGLVSVAKVFAANVEAALDRAEREQELRTREAEFRRQSERLGEFASVVSHDLRNPLGVAQGHLDILGEEVDSPHLDAIDAAHERMRTLIEDLLTLARQGQAVGDTESVDLRLLVTEAWVAVDGGALEAADDLGDLDCDDDRVRELLVNLFSNAVEHGGEDVTVTVGRLDEGGFYVADDGPGIPPDRREEVFERGVTTVDGGTGFGLAIVRSIAEAHGWSVSATESESGGARFEIRTQSRR